MKDETKQDTPLEVGIAPAFPPTEVPNLTTISDASSTTSAEGPIGDAHSTADNLADVVPNADE